MGAEKMGEIMRGRVSVEDQQNIQHCFLSHHGKPEWGSAVVPKTIEAYILHTADKFDSDTNAMIKSFQESEKEFVYVRSLDRSMKNIPIGEEDVDN